MSKPKAYDGPVVFVDGVHYPVAGDGHADMARPLRFDAATGNYRDAVAGEPSHNDANHSRTAELDPGAES